ncbi:MAG: InlB B-repeat-containing protein, partial [Clostridia bacterium]|nr:InlB B-repeat-containing protein [Clostridia bacterium]
MKKGLKRWLAIAMTAFLLLTSMNVGFATETVDDDSLIQNEILSEFNDQDSKKDEVSEEDEQKDDDIATDGQNSENSDLADGLSDINLEQPDDQTVSSMQRIINSYANTGIAPLYTTYYPEVEIVPANHSELKPIVKVGDSIGGGTVTRISGARIIVQCTMDGATGNTAKFRLPYANTLWDISSYRVDYISWAAQGTTSKSEGASASLSSGGCTAYYYFNYVNAGGGSSTSYLSNFTLNFNANGGTNAPSSLTYGTDDRYTKSHTFTIPSEIPTRDGYTFKGWADTANATSASRQPNGTILVAQTATGYNGGSVSKTLYAVWEKDVPVTTYTVTYTDGVAGEVIFTDQVYPNLLSGTATPAFEGTPTREGYVFAGWNPEVAEKVTANATYTATWKEDKNNNGTADDEEDKYTVTYTDGVDGEEIFADRVYSNLLSGTATPAFEGTPTREGYVFAGWNPEVAEKVTANATYTATWKEDKNNNGTADDEEKYTVTYTDGVEGEEVFADDVHEGLLSGTATPAFEGTTTREGYVFAGWNPTVADTVTEDATYTATWKEDKNNNGIADDEEVTVTFHQSSETVATEWGDRPVIQIYDETGSAFVDTKVVEVEKGTAVSQPGALDYCFTYEAQDEYEFKGWATADGALYDFDTPVTEDIDLYPVVVKKAVEQEEKTINVHFVTFEGSWTDSVSAEKSKDYVLSSLSPEAELIAPAVNAPEGKEFVNWNSDHCTASMDAGDAFSYNTMLNYAEFDENGEANITLKAIFADKPVEEKTINVHFVTFEGSWTDSVPAEKSKDYVLSSLSPEAEL